MVAVWSNPALAARTNHPNPKALSMRQRKEIADRIKWDNWVFENERREYEAAKKRSYWLEERKTIRGSFLYVEPWLWPPGHPCHRSKAEVLAEREMMPLCDKLRPYTDTINLHLRYLHDSQASAVDFLLGARSLLDIIFTHGIGDLLKTLSEKYIKAGYTVERLACKGGLEWDWTLFQWLFCFLRDQPGILPLVAKTLRNTLRELASFVGVSAQSLDEVVGNESWSNPQQHNPLMQQQTLPGASQQKKRPLAEDDSTQESKRSRCGASWDWCGSRSIPSQTASLFTSSPQVQPSTLTSSSDSGSVSSDNTPESLNISNLFISPPQVQLSTFTSGSSSPDSMSTTPYVASAFGNAPEAPLAGSSNKASIFSSFPASDPSSSGSVGDQMDVTLEDTSIRQASLNVKANDLGVSMDIDEIYKKHQNTKTVEVNMSQDAGPSTQDSISHTWGTIGKAVNQTYNHLNIGSMTKHSVGFSIQKSSFKQKIKEIDYTGCPDGAKIVRDLKARDCIGPITKQWRNFKFNFLNQNPTPKNSFPDIVSSVELILSNIDKHWFDIKDCHVVEWFNIIEDLYVFLGNQKYGGSTNFNKKVITSLYEDLEAVWLRLKTMPDRNDEGNGDVQ